MNITSNGTFIETIPYCKGLQHNPLPLAWRSKPRYRMTVVPQPRYTFKLPIGRCLLTERLLTTGGLYGACHTRWQTGYDSRIPAADSHTVKYSPRPMADQQPALWTDPVSTISKIGLTFSSPPGHINPSVFAEECLRLKYGFLTYV